MFITPTASFTRPSDTTAYTATDLVANSTTAGSVTPMQWSLQRLPTGGGNVIAARIAKSATSATAATFNVHLFSAAPVVTNGDNGTFAISTAQSYLGKIAVDMSTGGQAGTAYLAKSSAAVAIGLDTTQLSGSIYGLLEAAGTYTPASGEVFNVTLTIEG